MYEEGEKMKLPLQQLRSEYRDIYELLCQEPRIQKKDVKEVLGHTWETTSNRMKEAFEKGYIIGPHLKRKSFQNFKEYMYFLDCEEPLEVFLELIENQNVVYHARMDGFSNQWIISNIELDIDDVILPVGIRSDYLISYPPDHSLDISVGEMQYRIRHFNLKDYTQQGYIATHWDQTIEWSEKDELLFREFKYNFRKPLTPIADKHHMWRGDIYEFLEKAPECCTIATFFYPETLSAYDNYLYMFETDYEDFIIDLFSLLPTSTFFFKVSDKLFSSMLIGKQYMKNLDLSLNNIDQLHIPLMLRELKKKGILQSWDRAIIACHWRKDL
jgi:DNA-binding Lrp family transcriptional regulator